MQKIYEPPGETGMGQRLGQDVRWPVQSSMKYGMLDSCPKYGHNLRLAGKERQVRADRRTGLKCATNKCAQVEQAKAGGAGGQWGRGAPLELAALQLCQSQTQSRWRCQCEGNNSVRGVNSSSISSALVSGALLMPRPFDLYIFHYACPS